MEGVEVVMRDYLNTRGLTEQVNILKIMEPDSSLWRKKLKHVKGETRMNPVVLNCN